MTVALDGALRDGLEAYDPGSQRECPAGWWARAGAFGIDVLLGLGAVFSLLLVGWSVPRGSWLWWLCLVPAAAVVVAMAVNRLVLPALTGRSLGRAIMGIALVTSDNRRPDPWRLLLRELAHLLDTIPLFLGWLWPLIDDRGRTFADILTRTEARCADRAVPDGRRAVAVVAAVAAALAVAAATLGYLGVTRPERAVAAARQQIADEGPKLVVDMLSYTKKNVDEDFSKAQELVTEGYRPELVEQQRAVREAGLVDNDYWVRNSAVLTATANRAVMLMLLQGQRGAAPQQRSITASVRVDFERSPGDWKIAALTVLAPPKPSGAGQ